MDDEYSLMASQKHDDELVEDVVFFVLLIGVAATLIAGSFFLGRAIKRSLVK